VVQGLREGTWVAGRRAGCKGSGSLQGGLQPSRSGSSEAKEGEGMRSQIEFALAHPVFDPDRQILPGHFWSLGWASFGLTVNIGMS
jgi:hypothetical protein